MFSTQIIVSPFDHIFDIIYLFAAKFKKKKNPRIGILDKGLKASYVMISYQLQVFD